MALPEIAYDVDIANIEADDEDVLATFTLDGGEWTAASTTTYRLDDAGRAYLEVAEQGPFTSVSFDATYPVTWVVVGTFDVPDTLYTSTGQNMAAVSGYINGVEDGMECTFNGVAVTSLFERDSKAVLIWTADGDTNAARAYVNGALVSETTLSPYLGAPTPTVLPGYSKIYRAFALDHTVDQTEVDSLVAELQDLYFLEDRTVSWEAPAATSSPLTGYLVRFVESGVVTDHEVAPTETDVVVRYGGGDAVVAVFAKSAAGISAPAETTLP